MVWEWSLCKVYECLPLCHTPEPNIILYVNFNWKKKEAHYKVCSVGLRTTCELNKKVWIFLLPLQLAAESLRWYHSLGATWDQRVMLDSSNSGRQCSVLIGTHVPGTHRLLPPPPFVESLYQSMLAHIPSPLTKDTFYSKRNAAVGSHPQNSWALSHVPCDPRSADLIDYGKNGLLKAHHSPSFSSVVKFPWKVVYALN